MGQVDPKATESRAAVLCATCGGEPVDGAAAASLTWTRGVEHGAPVWTCDRCSREHLRSIEAKLDPTWW
ncbi:MAG: hypothetical protein ABIU87_05175 [Ornithinibacter sp.]